MLIQNNTPSAGYVSWSSFEITHQDITYTITNGNSNKKYIWWDFSSPTAFQESDTMPTLEQNDCIVIFNDSGTAYLWGSWKVHGELVIDGTIPLVKLETMPTISGQFIFTVSGELSVGANKTLELFPGASLTLTEVFISVKTAPTGATLIVDVNKNGTTIFTNQANRPTIADGETSDTSGTPDVTAIVKNDKITIDIDQVGSSTPGEDISIHVRFTQVTT
jgi:hypothetical protein